MSANRRFVVVMSWALTAALPVRAAAQTPRFDLPIRVGQTVRITTDDGAKTQGKVLTVTPASVVIGDGGSSRSSLAVADVRRIQTPDSVTNGVLIGAVSLGLVGGLAGAVGRRSPYYRNSDPAQGYESVGGAGFLIGAAVGATVGGLLGGTIDGARVRTIYERPAGGMTVSLRPIVSAAGKGVGVRLRW